MFAEKLGTDAATVLLNEGRIAEDDFYRALARHLGTDFLDGPIRLDTDLRYPQMLTAGAAPLAGPPTRRIVAAPRGLAIARLIEAASSLEHSPALTSPTRLREAVFAQVGEKIAADASDGLARHRPEWSCRPGPQTFDLALAGLVLALVVLLTCDVRVQMAQTGLGGIWWNFVELRRNRSGLAAFGGSRCAKSPAGSNGTYCAQSMRRAVAKYLKCLEASRGCSREVGRSR